MVVGAAQFTGESRRAVASSALMLAERGVVVE